MLIPSNTEKFPEITDVTVPELNERLNAINKNYPFEFPLWGIIALTVLTTVVVIILTTVTVICRCRGHCLVERYFTKKSRKPVSFDSVHYQPPSKTDLKSEDNSGNFSVKPAEKEFQLQEMNPKAPSRSARKSTPVTPNCVKGILQ